MQFGRPCPRLLFDIKPLLSLDRDVSRQVSGGLGVGESNHRDLRHYKSGGVGGNRHTLNQCARAQRERVAAKLAKDGISADSRCEASDT